jgi:hypothetical protein
MSYLSIVKDRWILDEAKATPFMRQRIATLVRTGYLAEDREQRRPPLSVFRIVGTRENYNQATDILLDNGWKPSFTRAYPNY